MALAEKPPNKTAARGVWAPRVASTLSLACARAAGAGSCAFGQARRIRPTEAGGTFMAATWRSNRARVSPASGGPHSMLTNSRAKGAGGAPAPACRGISSSICQAAPAGGVAAGVADAMGGRPGVAAGARMGAARTGARAAAAGCGKRPRGAASTPMRRSASRSWCRMRAVFGTGKL